MNTSWTGWTAATGSVALLVLAAGCGGSDPSAADPSTADPSSSVSATASSGAGGAPSLPPLTPCPTPAPTDVTFPSVPPATLPRPDFAADPQVIPSDATGVDVLTFSTAESLRDAVVFVTSAYPAAGWTLGDGDSEEDEADIPFVKGDLHGKLRLSGDGSCSTTWTVATVSGSSTRLDDVPGVEGHDG